MNIFPSCLRNKDVSIQQGERKNIVAVNLEKQIEKLKRERRLSWNQNFVGADTGFERWQLLLVKCCHFFVCFHGLSYNSCCLFGVFPFFEPHPLVRL